MPLLVHRVILFSHNTVEESSIRNVSLVKRRNGIIVALSLAGLLSVILLGEGCASKHPPAAIRFPITNGFHTLLPTEQQRILIWGERTLLNVTEEWLRSHHYSYILSHPQIGDSALDREAVLSLATEQQAEFVLLLERDELKTGALIESHCGPRFNISVTVRGLALVSRETVFRGSAYYPHCVDRTNEVYENLTCQALATTWGFRPSGQLEIPSSLACTSGQIPLSTTR
ncbi:hypothetical protein [Nitrospira sp. BLG_1]|uniref:hypothetical protein n=1 Tax=Nitrospira sp. BLG_1 TaxID=3395883 RepID=UPI0039BC32C1